MDHVSLRIEFSTDKFKLTGSLPAEVNAGNQFFGEDLARMICEALPTWQLDYMDEDWGWLVSSTRESLPAAERNSIGVYAFPTENQPNDHGQWMLMVEAEYLRPWLKFFSRWRKGRFNDRLATDCLHALRKLGVQELKATEVQIDSAGNERSGA